jgi:hypothetical protein
VASTEARQNSIINFLARLAHNPAMLQQVVNLAAGAGAGGRQRLEGGPAAAAGGEDGGKKRVGGRQVVCTLCMLRAVTRRLGSGSCWVVRALAGAYARWVGHGVPLTAGIMNMKAPSHSI